MSGRHYHNDRDARLEIDHEALRAVLLANLPAVKRHTGYVKRSAFAGGSVKAALLTIAVLRGTPISGRSMAFYLNIAEATATNLLSNLYYAGLVTRKKSKCGNTFEYQVALETVNRYVDKDGLRIGKQGRPRTLQERRRMSEIKKAEWNRRKGIQ